MHEHPRFYFVHSYHLDCHDESDVAGLTRYGYPFVSMIQKRNILGVQFHPEKPGLFEPGIEHTRSCNSTINFQEAIKNTDSYTFHLAYWKYLGSVLQKNRGKK